MQSIDREAVRAASRLEDVIPALMGYPISRTGGRELVTKCFMHDDEHDSLRIDPAKQVWFCDPCHLGGDVFTFIELLHDCTFAEALRFLAERAHLSPPTPRRFVRPDHPEREHIYTDARGVPTAKVLIWGRNPKTGKKEVEQQRADGHGGWLTGRGCMKDWPRVLYRLPDLAGHEEVVIGEGEKDVDALWARGIPATCNLGGAGQWRDEDSAQLVAAGVKRVRVIPDQDAPGRDHVECVARSCVAAGLDARIAELPDLSKKGGDVSDYLVTHTKADLLALLQAAPPYEPPVAVSETATCDSAPGDVAARPETSCDRVVCVYAENVMTSADAASGGKRSKKDTTAGRGVQLDDPEPWPDPVDGAELLDNLAAKFRKYLVLPPHAHIALGLWVLMTYVFDAFFVAPKLAITSPVKRCGKTLLLIVMGALTPRALLVSNISAAVLFRAIQKFRPTLLIDEADTFVKDNEELRGLMNSGHTRKTATVMRIVGDDHEPRIFSTWCPQAIALIGKLSDTLADRSIHARLQRRAPGEAVGRLRQDRIDAECESLRRQAARWAADHLRTLQDADPAVPAALHDRAADCWRPLLAIADRAGQDWPACARAAALALSGASSDDEQGDVVLLADIRTVFREAHDPTYLSSDEIVARLKALPESPWADWNQGRGISQAQLANHLHGFGQEPRKLRTRETRLTREGTPEKTGKRWHREDFIGPWAHYLPSDPPHPQQPNDSGHKPAIFSPPQSPAVAASKNAVSPMFPASVAGVAGSDPEKGDPGDPEGDEWTDLPAAGGTQQGDPATRNRERVEL